MIFCPGIGSNNSFYANNFMFSATLLIVLSYICFLQLKVYSILYSASILISFYILGMIYLSYQSPYRNAPISEQNSIVNFSGDKTDLFVDSETQKYVIRIKEKANKNGWKPRTKLIDLTSTPGISIILNSDILGTQWLAGGYKGSHQYVEKVLSLVKKPDLEKAWIFTSIDGKRAISKRVLLSQGLDFPSSYIKIGDFKYKRRNETHSLWKPKSN